MATRSARGYSANFFPQPGDVCRQASNPCVEVFDLGFVGGYLARRLVPALEDPRQVRQRRGLPGADLRGVDPVLAGELRQRLVVAQGRADHLRLELSTVMLSHDRSLRLYVFS